MEFQKRGIKLLNSKAFRTRTDTVTTSSNGNFKVDLPITSYAVIAMYRLDEGDSMVIPISYYTNSRAYNGGHVSNTLSSLGAVANEEVTVLTIYIQIK